MLRVLRVNDFADVTLACVNGHQVKAHKVILAANSTFLDALASQLVGMSVTQSERIFNFQTN